MKNKKSRRSSQRKSESKQRPRLKVNHAKTPKRLTETEEANRDSSG